jgi:4-amino-4-deoxy-L-arabinose transferase-like glycosyltransferase
LAVVAIVWLAALLRLAALGRWPPGLHFDEAVYGLQALEIVAGARPVFFSAYTGREPLYMYLMALLFAGSGPTVLALRLTSALIGTLTVALTYPLARSLYGRRVAWVATALLAVNYWHLTVSRNGYPNVLIPPLEAASAYCLWRGWRGGRRRDWALGGALAGLVLYTYLAARFWPVFLGVFLVYALIVDRRTWWLRRRGIATALLAAALVSAPLGWHFWQHPADFWERASQVLASSQLSGAELGSAYLSNLQQTALGYVSAGDPRWHYNLPGRAIFQPLLVVAFLTGCLLCLRRAREVRFGLPLLWIAVLSLPGILTLELQPATQRMFGVFPALVFPAALGLVWLAGAAARTLVRRGLPGTQLRPAALSPSTGSTAPGTTSGTGCGNRRRTTSSTATTSRWPARPAPTWPAAPPSCSSPSTTSTPPSPSSRPSW